MYIMAWDIMEVGQVACLLSRSASRPRRGSNWVAVGKGTLLCLPPTDRAPTDPADPEGADPFGPSRAESFSMDR
jgi:hypothetical protein